MKRLSKHRAHTATAANDVSVPMSELFAALSHPARIKILGLLSQQEHDVTYLQNNLQISQSAVSQHLNILKNTDLVVDRREGKHVFYRLKAPQVVNLLVHAIQLMMLHMAKESDLVIKCEEFLLLVSM